MTGRASKGCVEGHGEREKRRVMVERTTEGFEYKADGNFRTKWCEIYFACGVTTHPFISLKGAVVQIQTYNAR